ncbi:cell envelope integrity protein TolA [Afifella pfennigii]|uniref:cell envelope integrity protein TolA n=1 Tax=Afifella pfennigii TaxID=209897 RepID=UPI00047C56DC|nr:energy transducer TonB [Afifella pfennigii]
MEPDKAIGERASPLPPKPEEAAPELHTLQAIAEESDLAAPFVTPLPRARPQDIPEKTLAAFGRQKSEEKREVRTHRQAAERASESRRAAAQAAARPASNRAAAATLGGHATTGDPGPSRRAVSNYNSRVYSHLARYRRFPPGGRKGGRPTVRFTLSASGAAGGVRLVASSGDPAIDEAALAMVRRASPFPPIPREIKRPSLTFTVPIRFSRW